MPLLSPLQQLVNTQQDLNAVEARMQAARRAAVMSEFVLGTPVGEININGKIFTAEVARKVAVDIFKLLGEEEE